jgi:hypothetical protein
LFFPPRACEHIAEQTNTYAQQFLSSTTDLPPTSRYKKWKDTDASEVKAFISLQIAMGLCCKPSEAEYWSTNWLLRVHFDEVMKRDRYQLLKAFLHFNDNTKAPPRDSTAYNPLFKIQPLLDICHPTYCKVCKFKGRIGFKQYLPAKPVKWGFKDYTLSDAKTGFCLKTITYTGV